MYWIVRHASFLRVRFQTHENGRFSYHASRCVPYTSELCVFGDVALGKNNTDHRKKLDLDWSEGFPGRTQRDTNDEHLSLTSHGVMKTRSIRRKPAEQQFEKTVFDQVRGLP